MGLIQKVCGESNIFSELSKQLSAVVCKTAGERIYVVFDVYKDISIKSAERIQRGSDEGMAFIT